MTPAARIASAAEILDRILGGQAAERVLTNWARSNRFAGSKDRAAIRDLVFDGLRRRRSYAALGGVETGRGLMLGYCRANGADIAAIFSGHGHGPAPLSEEEAQGGRQPMSGAEACDCPDWIWDETVSQQGDLAEAIWNVQRDAAPVGLRANLSKTTADALKDALLAHGVISETDPLSPSALVLKDRPRGLTLLPEWQEGLFELQDVGSQWLSDQIPLDEGQSLLDFCAGGGGKTLAVAARVNGRFHAHDANSQRMTDLPIRAARAGVTVSVHRTHREISPCHTVLADVPCSGTGTWRRTPDAKWRFDQSDLNTLLAQQSEILDHAATFVQAGGYFVYATCSILRQENQDQTAAFLKRRSDFVLQGETALLPDQHSDGYYVAIMYHSS